MAERASDPYVNNRAFLSALTELGVPEQTARGALGSLAWESGKTLNNRATNFGDGADGSDSLGWGQWNQDRAVNLKKAAASLGTTWDDPRAQVQHIKNELTGPYKGVLDALKAKDDMYHGADVWTRLYENPKVKNVDQRYGRAMELAGAMGVDISSALPRSPTSLNLSKDFIGQSPAPTKADTGDLYTPLTAPDSSQDQRMAQREATAGIWETTAAAYSTSSMTSSILRAGMLGSFQPDASYRMTEEELQRRTQGLAPTFHNWFERAVSAEHADALERSAREQQQKLETLQAAGWKGTAASVLAMILDPAAIAAGVATGGLGVAATKAYQLGTASRIAVNAAIGAASNVGIDAALHAAGDPEEHSIKAAVATGLLFGGAYGWLAKPGINPTRSPIRRDINGKVIDTTAPRDWRGPGPDAYERPKGPTTGPTPEKPEIVKTPAPGQTTGTPEVDAAIARAKVEDANNPNAVKVATQVVNENEATRPIAALVDQLAAKFDITDLIRVGDIADHPYGEVRASRPYGVATPFHDGSYGLHINTSKPLQVQIETVAHEFAHIIDMKLFNLRNSHAGHTGGITSVIADVERAWKEWRARANGQTMQQFLDEYFAAALRGDIARRAPKAVASKNARAAFGSQWAYRTSNAEWFAQEMSKWFVSDPKPLSLVDRFWAKLSEYWSKLYSIATGKAPEPTPSQAFKDWVKGAYNENAVPDQTNVGAAALHASEGFGGPLSVAEGQQSIVFQGRPELAPTGGLGSISDAPETAFGRLRFSIAGQLGRSSNPAVRALGSALVEDTVGKKGGAANVASAEIWQTQRTKAAQTQLAQSRKVAYDKWREENGLGYFEARRRVGEFEEVLSAAQRERDPNAFAQYPQWAKQHVSNTNKINDTICKLANDPLMEEGIPDARPVGGFGAIPGDESYLTRVFSAKKIADLVETHGEARLVEFLKGAIKSAQPNIDPKVLDRLAAGYFREVYKRANGVIDEKVSRMFAVDNLEVLRDELQHRYGLAADEAEDIVKKLRGTGEGGKDARARRRVLLDESFTDEQIKMSDFLVNNHTALNMAYARHMYGKIALARTRIGDPETGELLVNGITNDGDWNALINHIRARGHDERIPAAQTEKEIEALQAAYDQISGVPHALYDQDWAKAVRVLGKFNLFRLGHQFTFAQLGETYNMVAVAGVKALAQQVPAFRRIITADGKWVKAHGLDREIEGIFGIGADRIRMTAEVSHQYGEDLRSLPMEAAGFWDKADHAMTTAGHAVLELSGFHLLDGTMKQWTAKAIAQKFADMARRAKEENGVFDTSHINYRRMAQLGLDDAMLQRVLRGVKDNFTMGRGAIFDHKVTLMNLDKWSDQEARIAFEAALMRQARMIIQENDIGSAHRWMSHPLWRMIMQFRAFPLHAWDKQLMMNLAMHDTTAVVTAALGAAIPTMVYAVQQNIAAIGRDDANKWLQKRLDAEHLATAAIQRHGWSSMIPTMIDTTMPFFGKKPIFDSRTTQQQADLIFGNPTASLITDVSKATGNIVKSFTQDRRLSQDELRDVARLFGNNLITGAILNSFAQGREVHPPKSAQR